MIVPVGFTAVQLPDLRGTPKLMSGSGAKSDISTHTELLLKYSTDQSQMDSKSITDAIITGVSISTIYVSSNGPIIVERIGNPYMDNIDTMVKEAKSRLARRLNLDVDLHMIAIRSGFREIYHNFLRGIEDAYDHNPIRSSRVDPRVPRSDAR